jgi:hypothetical protein
MSFQWLKVWMMFSLTSLTIASGLLAAGDGGRILSVATSADRQLTADPDGDFWKSIRGVVANRDSMGAPVSKGKMEVRSRWSPKNLYLLFVCDFDALTLKPIQDLTRETFGLWNWDVAEAFIGDDFQHINRYKEFEVSPRGEWIDLDIDSNLMSDSSGASNWESGFKVKARVDDKKKLWTAEMCIPFEALTRKEVASGQTFRANFYQAGGKDPQRLLLAWRPTFKANFHVPESFGILQLAQSNNLP